NYASGPLVLAAALLRIPPAIQEQNALAGFTNRVLGKLVRACFVAFEEARAQFPPRKTHLLGNPIRRAFLDNYLHTKAPGPRLSILITGGSQGAHVLNERVLEALEVLVPALGGKLSVGHQTGAKDEAAVAERYSKMRTAGLERRSAACIDDISGAYAQAALPGCRAGPLP